MKTETIKKNSIKKAWKTYKLFDISVDSLSVEDLHDYILNLVKGKYHEYILNVNIQGYNLMDSNLELRKAFKGSALTFLDGDGVRLGLSLLGHKTLPKITYARWINKFAKYSEINNLSWYLLGDTEPTLKKARENLFLDFPKLTVCGMHHGFFKTNDCKDVIDDIKICKPDILIIGMGMPRQELWLMDNWPKLLDIPCALTGGAVFKYLSGEAKQTPPLFYNMKLEWFYRFIHDPKRLFKRYFIGNPLFFIRLLLNKFGLKPKLTDSFGE